MRAGLWLGLIFHILLQDVGAWGVRRWLDIVILDRSIGRDEIKLGNNGFAWSAGVSVGYVLKRNFGARLFCDYSSTSTSLGLSPSTELGIMDISSKNRTIHALTWGATASILF